MIYQKDKTTFVLILSILISLVFIGCKTKSEDKIYDEVLEEPIDTIITVVTRSMEFQMPDTIPSGWNTFHYQNLSNETHFFVLERYPDSVTIENTKNEVGPVFDEAMELINNGKAEEGFAVFQKLPEWFFSVVFSGGTGLIAPQHTAETVVHLEPGYYIMECYVKMPNGQFHASMGMTKEVIISEENSGLHPPKGTVSVSISFDGGINIPDNISAGEQMFAVTFIDQKAHEHFIGHDVNLVHLGPNADLKALEAWMNWSDPKGLITPVPEGITFLGGVNDSPAGSVGYFKANITPGDYALIAEVPNAMEKGMLRTFTVE